MKRILGTRIGGARIGLTQAGALAAAAGLAAALAGAPAPAQDSSYRIRPGDVLRIEVIEDSGLNRSVLVAPDGRISLPLAGTVQAGGRAVEEVQSEIGTKLGANFAVAPTVFVGIERLAERAPAGVARTLTVHVLGEVGSPGRKSFAPGTTMLQAFAELGGFSRFAATKRIQLRRVDKTGTEQIFAIDYEAIQRGASTAGATRLADGDVILVPQRKLFE